MTGGGGVGLAPSANLGRKTVADWETSPHSRATLMQVLMLSPLTTRWAIRAPRSTAIAPAVGSLSLFSKMMRPRNWRSDSAVSLQRDESAGEDEMISFSCSTSELGCRRTASSAEP